MCRSVLRHIALGVGCIAFIAACSADQDVVSHRVEVDSVAKSRIPRRATPTGYVRPQSRWQVAIEDSGSRRYLYVDFGKAAADLWRNNSIDVCISKVYALVSLRHTGRVAELDLLLKRGTESQPCPTRAAKPGPSGWPVHVTPDLRNQHSNRARFEIPQTPRLKYQVVRPGVEDTALLRQRVIDFKKAKVGWDIGLLVQQCNKDCEWDPPAAAD